MTGVFRKALHTAGFVGGPMAEHSRGLCRFCDTGHAVAVSSGTDALRFAMMACGMKPGRRGRSRFRILLSPPPRRSRRRARFRSSSTSTNAPTTCRSPAGASILEAQCTRNAIGRTDQPAQRPAGHAPWCPSIFMARWPTWMPSWNWPTSIGLIVIEDACQAHGAEYFSKKHNRWMKAGSMGHAAAFSFYPGKNLGACGEGGRRHDQRCGRWRTNVRMLRDHGQVKKYYHDVEGYNGRLDAIQAGILSAKLAHLAQWNAQRRERADEYNRLLAENGAITLPIEPWWSNAVYHLYVIRSSDRDGMMSHLKSAGVGSGIHYPIPLHLQNAYAGCTTGAETSQ